MHTPYSYTSRATVHRLVTQTGRSVPRYENAHRRGLLVQLPAGRPRTTRGLEHPFSYNLRPSRTTQQLFSFVRLLPACGPFFILVYPSCSFFISSRYGCIHARAAHAVQWCLPPHHHHTAPTPHGFPYFPGPYARSLVCAGPVKPFSFS